MSEHWLRRLQDEVGEWSEENFGAPDEQGADLPLLGAGEELGELSTSVLKQVQGIDDSEKYADRVGPEAEKDAIADVTIYLLDVVHRLPVDIDLVELYQSFTQGDMKLFIDVTEPVPMMQKLYAWYGSIANQFFVKSTDEYRATVIEADIATILAGLYRLCEIRGYDYRQCVIETWEDVSDREWEADITQ